MLFVKIVVIVLVVLLCLSLLAAIILIPILVIRLLFNLDKKVCPNCGAHVVMKVIQPQMFGWKFYEDDYECPICEHKWMDMD